MATSKIKKEVKVAKIPFTWTPQGKGSVHMETLDYTSNTDVQLANIISVTIVTGSTNAGAELATLGNVDMYFWIIERDSISLSAVNGVARILYY